MAPSWRSDFRSSALDRPYLCDTVGVVNKLIAVVGLSVWSAGVFPGYADESEKTVRKVAPRPLRYEQSLDLRGVFCRTPHHVENAAIYKESFGSVMYWGPRTLGRWAEIQYRFDFPFAAQEIIPGMGLTVYNRNLKPNFDDAAQGTLEVSMDGKNWLLLYSSHSETGIKDHPGVLKKMRGARTFFIKARLFATKSLNRNYVQIAQFLRSEPEKGKFPVLSATGTLSSDHSVFPGWRQFAIHQRRGRSGCIATGYEMLLRASGVRGINYASFQDDFDLDIKLGRGQAAPRNNFMSVAAAVRSKYPEVHFAEKSFAKGKDKIAFIDECLGQQRPILLSLAQFRFGRPSGWHIMPIVDATADAYLLLRFVRKDGSVSIEWMKKSAIAKIHDEHEGGKEVAFLVPGNPEREKTDKP